MGEAVRTALVDGARAPGVAGLLARGGELDAEAASESERSLLIRTGLARRKGGVLRALARADAWDGLLYLHDAAQGEEGRDTVYGVGPNTKALLRMTPRVPGERALDVGCGQGMCAFTSARHCAVSVGSDINRRAVHLARVGGALNGLTGAEFRAGALLQPVAGETFDLVTCNAPFVFSGTRSVHEGGAAGSGDDFTRALLEGLPSALREGGFAAVLCNWEHERADDWSGEMRALLEGGACDAWVVRLRTSTTAGVQERWFADARDPDVRDESADVESLRRWREHLHARERHLTMGFVFLRRRSGRTWFRADTQRLTPGDEPAGAQVEAVFRAETFVRSLADESVLDHVYEPACDRREREEERGMVITEHARGLRFSMAMEAPVRRVLGAFDGERTARRVLHDVFGDDGGPHAPRIVTELLRRGYIAASGRTGDGQASRAG
ncbi:MAG: methyltransferase [Planctomycetota bacterium]|nr:methyltransferase [Planctomycetota bacterium]